MGYLLNGEYHKGKPDFDKIQPKQQTGWKQWDHNRQRKDYAREIVQPYDRHGNPNPHFEQAWPEESKQYKENASGQN